MPLVQDQLGRTVDCPSHPQRIVSLVPSQTELLHYLGLGDRVVGLTKFCIHPNEWFRSKERIGGTKNPDIEKIIRLNPDLVLANKEENDKKTVLQLAEHIPVWISDVHNMRSAREMILRIGEITHTSGNADKLNGLLSKRLEQVEAPKQELRTLYLVWNDPIMVAGDDTFINSNMRLFGFHNVEDRPRYPELSLKSLIETEPDVVLYPSEPFPFKKKHISRFREVLPNAHHLLVDGEAFSWYGNRMLEGLSQINAYRQHIDQTSSNL